MDQNGKCPACGAISFRWATWCPTCGFVFPTATAPGYWPVGRQHSEQAPEGVTPPAGQLLSPAPTSSPGWYPNPWAWPPSTPPSSTPPSDTLPSDAPPSSAWQPPDEPPDEPPAAASGSTPSPTPLPWSRGLEPQSATSRGRAKPSPGTTVGVLSFLVVAAVVAASFATSHRPDVHQPYAPSYPGTGFPMEVPVTPTPAPATPRPVTPKPPLIQNGKFVVFGDGTFMVGTDVPPGIYRSGNDTGPCHWERLSAVTWDGGGVVISSVHSEGRTLASIDATDAAFFSEGCGAWTNELSRITANKTEFDDGTYLVGMDVEPGTYSAAGGSRCYWTRLSAFGGTTGDILGRSVYGDEPQTAVILPSDKGFFTEGCGTWTFHKF